MYGISSAKRKEKHTRVTFEIEPVKDTVRLTVTHDPLEPESEMLKGITTGWPKVLSSLKSLLEVGRPLPDLWEQPAGYMAGGAPSGQRTALRPHLNPPSG